MCTCGVTLGSGRAGDQVDEPTERVVHGWARERDWRLPEHFTSDWVPLPEFNRDHPADPFRPYGVREHTDPLTYAYLKALGRRIGVEVSVNTSFNVAGPIAQTPQQVQQVLPFILREARRGLIQQKHGRLGQDHPRQLEQTPLTGRQPLDAVAREASPQVFGEIRNSWRRRDD